MRMDRWAVTVTIPWKDSSSTHEGQTIWGTWRGVTTVSWFPGLKSRTGFKAGFVVPGHLWILYPVISRTVPILRILFFCTDELTNRNSNLIYKYCICFLHWKQHKIFYYSSALTFGLTKYSGWPHGKTKETWLVFYKNISATPSKPCSLQSRSRVPSNPTRRGLHRAKVPFF